MLPLQFAASFPAFETHKPTRDESGQVDWMRYDTAQMRWDRASYLH